MYCYRLDACTLSRSARTTDANLDVFPWKFYDFYSYGIVILVLKRATWQNGPRKIWAAADSRQDRTSGSHPS